MSLTKTAAKKLKALAHHLNPVILTGNKGVTEKVCLETSRALEIHELIKIRVNAADRDARSSMIQQICDFCQADLVGTVGHIAILYRENPEIRKYAAATAVAKKSRGDRRSPGI